MEGRIKMFNEDRGFGFILGNDENDYFFHISNVKSAEPIYQGALVEFTPMENEKGKIAKNVILSKKMVGKPAFIAFGDVRIKLSNIKDYGISNGKIVVDKIFENVPVEEKGFFRALFGSRFRWNNKLAFQFGREYGAGFYPCGMNNPFWILVREADGNLRAVSLGPTEYSSYEPTVEYFDKDYLYITTYQKDNYKFFDCVAPFDIYEKCKEIDQYML